MRSKLDQRLRTELSAFFRSRERKSPIMHHSIAVAFSEHSADLVREWYIEQFCVMLRLEIALMLKPPKSQPPKAFQMFLPGFRGDLEERIPVEEGRLVKLGQATVNTLRENLRVELRTAVAEAKSDPKFIERKRFIEDMALYARTCRGLTVKEYCQLKAAGLPPGGGKKGKT